MNRTSLVSTFASALLILVAAGTLFSNLAMANPSPELDFPHEPIMTPPMILVSSPLPNQNYNASQILLNFSIIKPEAWLQRSGFYGASDKYGNKSYNVLGNVTSVYYLVDDGERQNISIHDAPSWFDFHPKPLTLNFSLYLTLAKGTHNVKVGFEADSYYLRMIDDWNGYISSIVMNGTSEPIVFSVLQEPFPTTMVIATSGVSLAFISIGIVVYFKKRKNLPKI